MRWLERKLRDYFDWVRGGMDSSSRLNELGGMLFVLPFFVIVFILVILMIWLA